MPITITEQVYVDHPQIAVIKDCLQLAQEEVSGIPEYSLRIPGMSGIVYRRFINNYVLTLEAPKYLEVGVWTGSTLCAAIGNIENIRAVAVDNYSESYPHYSTSPEKDCRENVAAVKTESADITLLLNQAFETFDPTPYGPFNVYMYDGYHDEESQYQGIKKIAPCLEEISLVIVDDWNDNEFFEVEYKGVVYPSREKAGTYRAFDESNLEVLYKIEVETGENPMFPSPWHNGYGIFLVKNNK